MAENVDPIDAIAAARKAAAAQPLPDQLAAILADLQAMRPALEKLQDRAAVLPDGFAPKATLTMFLNAALGQPQALTHQAAQAGVSPTPAA